MLRKFGFAGLFLAGAIFLTGQLYKVSTIPGLNAWLVEQQRIVQAEPDAAPFKAKAAVAFSELPNAVLNSLVGHAEAQSTPSQTVERANLRNHVSVSQGTRASVANATITSGSTDYRGRFSNPTSASVTVTFGTAYASAPWCDVTRSDGQSSVGPSWIASTTGIVFSTVTIGAGTIMNWRCDGVMP